MLAFRPSRAGLLLPLLLAGCAGFYDEIFLNADGSGKYRLTVFVRKDPAGEDLEAFRSSVRERSAAVAAASGFVLESADVKRDGALLVVEVTASFRDLSVFSNPALSVSPDGGRWAFVVPRDASFRDGRFTARVLRGSAPAKDHAIRTALRGREARFTVHLPGTVVESNGDRLERTANWAFPLDQLCDAPVGMIAVAELGAPWMTLALGAAIVAGLAVLGVSLFRRRRAA